MAGPIWTPEDLRRGLRTGLLMVLVGSLVFLALKPDPVATLTKRRDDFRCYYWWSAALVREGDPHQGPALAEEATGEACYQYAYYPPSLLVAFAPLTLLSETAAQLVFYAALALGAGVFFGLCGVFSGYPRAGPFVAAAWVAFPVLNAINLGQPTPLTAAAFAASLLLLFEGREWPAAWVIAATSALKPLEVMYWLPIALGVRPWAIPRSAVAFGALALLSLPFVGVGLWWEFLTAIPGTAAHRYYVPPHYQIPMAALVALAVGCRHAAPGFRPPPPRPEDPRS